MPRYSARAEFRRLDRDSSWVLAGVVIGHRFWPSEPGVERVRGRLVAAGLLGWTDLPTPIVARDADAAAEAALELARAGWPDRRRARVPHASGVAEPHR
ncbi:MAG TPA: hypothetical protein VGQ58_01325 [Candidatus Limnocylindrales bacterium]|jgi:hypothetical protein|nr:hypothetical protein [Candidatus Limnocylindrales bacterium]